MSSETVHCDSEFSYAPPSVDRNRFHFGMRWGFPSLGEITSKKEMFTFTPLKKFKFAQANNDLGQLVRGIG
ncbi:hypothetical protein TNCV_535901 [Trichonephila clavipes]|nr:hypothetical protein TNCV_535901 [Trichonephila clavipes]